MKRVLMTCALLLLTACNRVYTSEPMFTEADAIGAPVLRDGLWLRDPGDEAPCPVDTTQPANSWPVCAEWFLLEGGVMRAPSSPEPGVAFSFTDVPLIIAAGKPVVVQMQLDDPEADRTQFVYFGLGSTRTDDQGRVVAVDAVWPTFCGPPRKGEAPGSALTDRLYPGLEPDPAVPDNCTTASRQAVRHATQESRHWPVTGMRWIREGVEP